MQDPVDYEKLFAFLKYCEERLGKRFTPKHRWERVLLYAGAGRGIYAENLKDEHGEFALLFHGPKSGLREPPGAYIGKSEARPTNHEQVHKSRRARKLGLDVKEIEPVFKIPKVGFGSERSFFNAISSLGPKQYMPEEGGSGSWLAPPLPEGLFWSESNSSIDGYSPDGKIHFWIAYDHSSSDWPAFQEELLTLLGEREQTPLLKRIMSLIKKLIHRSHVIARRHNRPDRIKEAREQRAKDAKERAELARYFKVPDKIRK